MNIGISIWLGHVMGETFYGFFAVGGFYIVMATALIIFKKKWLKNPMTDIVINKMLIDNIKINNTRKLNITNKQRSLRTMNKIIL